MDNLDNVEFEAEVFDIPVHVVVTNDTRVIYKEMEHLNFGQVEIPAEQFRTQIVGLGPVAQLMTHPIEDYHIYLVNFNAVVPILDKSDLRSYHKELATGKGVLDVVISNTVPPIKETNVAEMKVRPKNPTQDV